MNLKKRILVAPLNWGIGHATRCIPIVNALIVHGFEPVIASDGMALLLLQKEFPFLESIALPEYNIQYSNNPKHLKLKLLKDSPQILKAIIKEKKQIDTYIANHNISGLISDNRFGVYSKEIPSIFLTHQLQVLSGNTTWLSTKIHREIIKKFDQCWVPDVSGNDNLSGNLGHTSTNDITTRYIGAISRLKRIPSEKKYDLMVLLSGPEPQRTLLENKLLYQLEDYYGKVVFIRGIIEDKQTKRQDNNLTIINYLESEALEKAINESAMVLSRSGYSTILDLAKLEKKAFFIPTPGQYEQEYLASYLKQKNMAPSCSQDEFSIDKLNEIDSYSGFTKFDTEVDFGTLFSFF